METGRPYLYHCDSKSQVLSTVLKLFTLQDQLPSASQLLFCDESTTLEQIECFLQRVNLNYAKLTNNNKINNNSNETGIKYSTDPILHCLVMPEKLRNDVQDEFGQILQKNMHCEQALLAIVMCDSKNRIYEQLMPYYHTRLALTERDQQRFFQLILEKDLETFLKQNDTINMVNHYVLFIYHNANVLVNRI